LVELAMSTIAAPSRHFPQSPRRLTFTGLLTLTDLMLVLALIMLGGLPTVPRRRWGSYAAKGALGVMLLVALFLVLGRSISIAR
jgi:hypothetical protein